MRANNKRMLRQLKTGRIYFYTPLLGKRKDMVEIDMETAKTMMEAQSEQMKLQAEALKDPAKLAEHRARMEELRKASEKLSDAEKAVENAEAFKKKEIEAAIIGEKAKLNPDDLDLSTKEKEIVREAEDEADKGRIIGQDKEYQSILVMKTKQELLDYLAANYGIKEDGRQPIEKIRYVALEKRKKRIFEV